MARACAWPNKMTKRPCGRKTSWIVGEGFDGEELTYWSRFCEHHELLARQKGVPTDLAADVEWGECEFELVRPDPVECARWINGRHAYWCETLRLFASRLGEGPSERAKYMPSAALDAKARTHSGIYYPSRHRCEYSLPYAMSQRGYDKTIAHEVCHAYAGAVMPKHDAHGELFMMLMRLACEFESWDNKCIQYSAYSAQAAIALAKEMRPRVLAAVAAGEMPLEVVT